jgi:hypothetical protein
MVATEGVAIGLAAAKRGSASWIKTCANGFMLSRGGELWRLFGVFPGGWMVVASCHAVHLGYVCSYTNHLRNEQEYWQSEQWASLSVT